MTPVELTRSEAYDLVVEKIGVNNLLKHILSVEVGMRRLAEYFDEDVELWGMTGLLHDLDYNETKEDADRHTFVTESWLAKYNLPVEMIHAIRAHPGHIPCVSKLDYALYAVDPATGFIVACALMHPSKKLASIDRDFMLRRFAEKRFAAGATRENIEACSNIGLEVGEFLDLIKEGMLTIVDQLKL